MWKSFKNHITIFIEHLLAPWVYMDHKATVFGYETQMDSSGTNYRYPQHERMNQSNENVFSMYKRFFKYGLILCVEQASLF